MFPALPPSQYPDVLVEQILSAELENKCANALCNAPWRLTYKFDGLAGERNGYEEVL